MGSMDRTVTFHRIYEAAIPPLRSDKAALGTLPSAAFQYCEPVRTASAYGWNIFPPRDIRLLWDGVDIFFHDEDEWCSFSSIHLDADFVDYWDTHAPQDLQGCAPPFLTNIFVPGVIQIWSGYLVSSAPDWSVLIGPIANVPESKSYACYEGIVETDVFQPCPLFINIRLLGTDREIFIPRDKPLFQVRPIRRDCYADSSLLHEEFVGLDPRTEEGGGMSQQDWDGYRSTIRRTDPTEESRSVGSYAAARRKRAKQERVQD